MSPLTYRVGSLTRCLMHVSLHLDESAAGNTSGDLNHKLVTHVCLDYVGPVYVGLVYVDLV